MDEIDLNEAKRGVLSLLVAAHNSLVQLYYRRDMMVERTPECVYALSREIDRMRKDLAGA